jgi:antitoxin CptB
MNTPLDEKPVSVADLNRLKWRCRRGLLENDIFLERFFLNFGEHLTYDQVGAVSQLMELEEGELLDILLARKTLGQVAPYLETKHVLAILPMLQKL